MNKTKYICVRVALLIRIWLIIAVAAIIDDIHAAPDCMLIVVITTTLVTALSLQRYHLSYFLSCQFVQEIRMSSI